MDLAYCDSTILSFFFAPESYTTPRLPDNTKVEHSDFYENRSGSVTTLWLPDNATVKHSDFYENRSGSVTTPWLPDNTTVEHSDFCEDRRGSVSRIRSDRYTATSEILAAFARDFTLGFVHFITGLVSKSVTVFVNAVYRFACYTVEQTMTVLLPIFLIIGSALYNVAISPNTYVLIFMIVYYIMMAACFAICSIAAYLYLAVLMFFPATYRIFRTIVVAAAAHVATLVNASCFGVRAAYDGIMSAYRTLTRATYNVANFVQNAVAEISRATRTKISDAYRSIAKSVAKWRASQLNEKGKAFYEQGQNLAECRRRENAVKKYEKAGFMFTVAAKIFPLEVTYDYLIKVKTALLKIGARSEAEKIKNPISTHFPHKSDSSEQPKEESNTSSPTHHMKRYQAQSSQELKGNNIVQVSACY